MSVGGTTTLVVENSEPGQRLDRWLQARFASVSRGTFQRLIAEHHLQVDGRPVKPTHTPRAGETISIAWPSPKPADALPEPLPLQVLYEDAHLLVVNKTAGMPVHPSAGHETGTLVNALLHHCAGHLSGIGGVARPGVVHRLDLDTSGCLVVAKDDPTHLALSGQFAGRNVEKLYVALVCGHPLPESGEVRAAIARHPAHRKRMAVTEGSGREAWTSYRTLEQQEESALVEARLHTGRTHQIRVHFKHIRCPLVGDLTYGRRQNQRLKAQLGVSAARQMLHAWRLTLDHPQTGQRLQVEAPWPDDFQTTLRHLRDPRRGTG